MPVLEFICDTLTIGQIRDFDSYKKACEAAGVEHIEAQYKGCFEFVEGSEEDRYLYELYLQFGGDLQDYLEVCEKATVQEKAKIFALSLHNVTDDIAEAYSMVKDVIICEKRHLKRPCNLKQALGVDVEELMPFLKFKKLKNTLRATGVIGKFNFAGVKYYFLNLKNYK